MARCKAGKCGCGTRIISNAVNQMNGQQCFDVCTTPICGSPDYLGLFAPVIYDEIGINLCTTFDLGIDIPTAYPTATTATAQIIDITYTYGDGGVEITQISGRPNCYSVTLTNLTVQFAVNLYDEACRLIDTIFVSALYLPSDTTEDTYDEDTNPTTVTLELFAPYGVAYNNVAGVFTPALNAIGFASTDNMVRQGLNLVGTAKVLNFDETDSTITIGVTLVIQSLYYAGYKVANAGRIVIPKGCIVTPEDTDCLKFVAGDLLNLEIRPLDLGVPGCQENLKQDCAPTCNFDCSDNI